MKKTALSLFLLAGLAAPLFAQTPDCPKDKCKSGSGCCKTQCAEAKACEGAAKVTAVSQKSAGACCTKQTDKAMTKAATKKAVVKPGTLVALAAK
ncbi:hypothetical protein [Arsenicibacter rosenii]|uniref:Uncharacterized protein n=1 Tax=Arsenicibacter rosenii TaxID=1750698 RepID=A0A1S2VNM7_9BACT|nr:hypothetical protein [Arsenicibacter rosenii]OIN60373.1 hypothetical protein BLX24_05985 [Arsenicibacter rosenii]